jgi:hypothetical protein
MTRSLQSLGRTLAPHRLCGVPRIASFDGLVIRLYFGDHPPPHVHVYAGRLGHPGVQAARFSIDTGELIAGKLPAAKVARITRWCLLHRQALLADWERAQVDRHPVGRYDSS